MVYWYNERRKNDSPTVEKKTADRLIDACARLESRLGIVTVTPDEQNLDFVQSEIEQLVRPGDVVQRTAGAIQVLAAGADYEGVRAIASRLKLKLNEFVGHVYGTSEDARTFKDRLKESAVLRMAIGLDESDDKEISSTPLEKDELVRRVSEVYSINPKVFAKAKVSYFVPKEGEAADYVQFEPWAEGAHIPADYPKLLRPTIGKKPARFEYDVATRVAAGGFVVFAKRSDDLYEFNQETGKLRKTQK